LKSSFYQEKKFFFFLKWKIIVEILSMNQNDLRRVEFNSDEPELEIHAPRDDEFVQVEQAQKMAVDQPQKVVVTIQLELSLVGQAVPPISVRLLNSSTSHSGLLPCQGVEIGQDNKSFEQGCPSVNRIISLAPVKPVMEMLRKEIVS
jgi:hypothetical protein